MSSGTAGVDNPFDVSTSHPLLLNIISPIHLCSFFQDIEKELILAQRHGRHRTDFFELLLLNFRLTHGDRVDVDIVEIVLAIFILY